ncbi:MAG: hypothetical protein JWM68_2213 [Verrucomicrobiales bacterium]|nr:hypothetical protein [Verrucomicrobiales bacterium]
MATLRRRNIFNFFGSTIVASTFFVGAHAMATEPALSSVTVPEGFEIEVVAEPPLIGHPMMAGFDDRGRLFIAEAGGTNAVDEVLQVVRPNFIRMIEDTDGDGKFDKSTIFADKLVTPNGALWHDGSLYVAEPPGIWRMTDTNNDGVADVREHLAAKVHSNGMSATLHGPTEDPTGELFWCGGQQGFSFDKNVEMPKTRMAPGVFTLHDDGSANEMFASGGLANPVEVTFGPNGEVFGTVSILDTPEGARHDALMHWVYGGVYNINKNSPCSLKRTGDFLPPLSHVGQVAPAGLTRYRGQQFGAEYRDNIFWAQFNTHKIMRTQITPDGATFRSQDSDFFVADDLDFHCTDVIEDADGSLLVINTGGWFRHGCPTSQIAKPDVKGAIYRIRRKGAVIPNDPRGLKVDWTKSDPTALAQLLADSRPVVVDRAITELAHKEAASLSALKSLLQKSANMEVRRNAVWALSRIKTEAAQKVLRLALSDKDKNVRQSAVYAAGRNRDKNAAEILQSIVLRDSEPAIRREAAAALGRIGNPKSIPSLLAAFEGKNDAFLTHSLIYALIQINNPAGTKLGLIAQSAPVQRGAMIALEQMDNSQLSREEMIPLLASKDFDVQKAAFTIASRRKDLTTEMAQALKSWLDQPKPSEEQIKFIQTALTAKTLEPELERVVGQHLSEAKTSLPVRRTLLDVIAKSEQKELPGRWIASLEKELQRDSGETRLQAIQVIQQRGNSKLDGALKQLADDATLSAQLRIAALSALAPRLRIVPEAHLTLLKESLRPQSSPLMRLASARTMAALHLSDEQIVRLAEFLPEVDSLALPTVLRSFARKTNDIAGFALVAGLEKAPSAQNLGADEATRIISTYSSSVREKAKPLLAQLGADLEKKQQRLKDLEGTISGGDSTHGKEVFFGKKASCFTCHRIRGQGGIVGPNLSTIGGVRVGRDFLESIVFPSSSIVQGYHTFNVQTTDDEQYTGIIIRETPEAIWIRGTDLAEIRIETKNIKVMNESKLSIMPQGLDANLSSKELSDLIAYLQSLK